MSNWVQVRYEKPKQKYLRSFRYNLNQWAAWNYDGDRLFSGFNVNAHAVFTNNWATGIGGNINPQPFDDRGTRGGPGVYGNAQRSIWGYVEGDERPAVRSESSLSSRPMARARPSTTSIPSLSYRPSSFLKVTGGLHFSRNHDESQWVEATGRWTLYFRSAASGDCRSDGAAELHRDARALDSALRGAVRFRRRLFELQGARERPLEIVRRPLQAD